MVEGYVFHTYGKEKYLRQAVASAVTLRRHESSRPFALFAPQSLLDVLESHGLDSLFQVRGVLSEEHCSIVGFKHHLHRFMPFDANLYVDADMVWCQDPDPLWSKLRAFSFTATGQERSDFWFGGPKGFGVVVDYVLDRRRRTMKRFGLTYLPRVQAGMLYASDPIVAEQACLQAQEFLAQRSDTHFRSRLSEGRSEESCEWSLAMAMSRMDLPILHWFQAHHSPQLDYVSGLVEHDMDFETVRYRYYTDPSVQALRGIPSPRLRKLLISAWSRLPGRGDYIDITPFALHFGWLREKAPYLAFADRTWERLIGDAAVEEARLALG